MNVSRSIWFRCAVATCLPGIASTGFAEGFSPAASMHQARFGHTATLLGNGKVLVAGGGTIDDILASSELYDPATDRWAVVGSLAHAREYHAATLLASGKVLVTGGSDAGTPLDSAEIFDPATNTWSAAASMHLARVRHTAQLTPAGTVFVAYGMTAANDSSPTGSTEIYDPATDAWANGPSGPVARAFHQGALLSDGYHVLEIGGQDATAPSASGEQYDLNTGNRVGPFPAMSTARDYFALTPLPARRALAAGGFDASWQTLGSAEYYDENTNHWTPTGPMAAKRYAHTASALDDLGDVLVVGGVTTDASLTSAEIYSAQGNTWSATASSMQTGRAQHTATALGAGRVLVCGGQTGAGDDAVETATCETYTANLIYRDGFD